MEQNHRPMTFRILQLLPLLLLTGCNFIQQWDEKSCAFDDKYCDKPLYLSLDQLQRLPQPDYGSATTLKDPGKMFWQGNTLIVVDRYRGYHFFDVTDRQNPQRKLFLPLPGATDVTVHNGVLYGNSFDDLFSFQVADLIDGSYGVASVKRLAKQFARKNFRHFYQGAVFSSDVRPNSSEKGLVIGFERPDGSRVMYGVEEK